MVLFNYAIREITAKIVYYGPGLGGKTTNLQKIHESLDTKARGKLISLATDADRTLFFDFMPLDLGYIGDYRVRFQLYTVPGQVHYNATRKLVLKGVDSVVFVADSQIEMIERDRESYDNLRENLTENGYELKNIPVVFQFNKQDLPNVATPEEIASSLELDLSKCTYYESVATEGKGVFECLKAIIKVTVEKLRKQFEVGKLQETEDLRKPASAVPEETEDLDVPDEIESSPVEVEAPVMTDEIEVPPEETPLHERPAHDESPEAETEAIHPDMSDEEMDEVDLEVLLTEEIPEKEPEMEIVYPSGKGAPPAEMMENMVPESKEDMPEETDEIPTDGQEISETVPKGPDEAWDSPEEKTGEDEILLESQPVPDAMGTTREAVDPSMEKYQEERESESLLEEVPGYDLEVEQGYFPDDETEDVIFSSGGSIPEGGGLSTMQEEGMPEETIHHEMEEKHDSAVVTSSEMPESKELISPDESSPQEQKPQVAADDIKQLKEEMASIRGKTDDLEKSMSVIKSTLEENRRLLDKVIDITTRKTSKPGDSDDATKPDLPDKAPRRRGLLSKMFGT